MGQQDQDHGDMAPPPWVLVSIAEADTTAKLIMRGAGVLILVSLLWALILPSGSSMTGPDAIWLSPLVVFGAMLIFVGPRWLRTTAKVGPDEVFLSCVGFRARLPLCGIESVTNSRFPGGGYGYRFLGKGHRGFISGGPQVDIKMRNGREYTVSVQSVDEFRSATTAAQARK